MPGPVDLSKLIRQRMTSDRAGRGKTALVRTHLNDIEAAVDAGFTYVQIAGWLGEAGALKISGRHLSTIVAQIQKRKKGRKIKGKPIVMETESKKFEYNPLASGKEMM